jgi:hypothetical protein
MEIMLRNSNVVNRKVVIFSLSLPIILSRYPLIDFAEGGESLAVCEYGNELNRPVKKQVIFFIV